MHVYKIFICAFSMQHFSEYQHISYFVTCKINMSRRRENIFPFTIKFLYVKCFSFTTTFLAYYFKIIILDITII